MTNYNLEKTNNITNNQKVNTITSNENVNVIRNYKDTVFRMLFNNKEKLLELYNGVNNTHYTNVEDLTINTLENAIYLNMKNDVSCVFNFSLNIYEHQSSYNPNMPLRNLFYVAKLIEKELIINEKIDSSIYGESLLYIPTPRFIVFYNGTDLDLPDKSILKLSDSYKGLSTEPELELKVTVLNININKNKALFDQCTTLHEYSLYVDYVRKFSQKMPIKQAVQKAVDYCIDHNILSDFLRKNKAEVVYMSILECNYEIEMEKIKRGLEKQANERALEEVRNKYGEQIKAELRIELNEQVRTELRDELNDSVKSELRDELAPQVEAEIHSEIRTEFLLEQINKKLKKGKSPEMIADELEQPLEVITKLLKTI